MTEFPPRLLAAQRVQLAARRTSLHAGSTHVGWKIGAGIPEADALKALWPLMASAVDNLKEIGLPGALTGPVARGDVVSVERHLKALSAKAPEHADVYKRLGREVLTLARKRAPDLDETAAQKLAKLFG